MATAALISITAALAIGCTLEVRALRTAKREGIRKDRITRALMTSEERIAFRFWAGR